MKVEYCPPGIRSVVIKAINKANAEHRQIECIRLNAAEYTELVSTLDDVSRRWAMGFVNFMGVRVVRDDKA